MRRLRVVLIDDDPDFANTTAILLKLMGHDPQVFGEAQTAFAAMHEQKPDVILSDLAMPEMSGCELADRVRGHQGLKDIPLVAITGYDDAVHTAQAIDAGFDYRLVKPVTPEELHELLDHIVEAHG